MNKHRYLEIKIKINQIKLPLDQKEITNQQEIMKKLTLLNKTDETH